jgi:hypothetical protein
MRAGLWDSLKHESILSMQCRCLYITPLLELPPAPPGVISMGLKLAAWAAYRAGNTAAAAAASAAIAAACAPCAGTPPCPSGCSAPAPGSSTGTAAAAAAAGSGLPPIPAISCCLICCRPCSRSRMRLAVDSAGLLSCCPPLLPGVLNPAPEPWAPTGVLWGAAGRAGVPMGAPPNCAPAAAATWPAHAAAALCAAPAAAALAAARSRVACAPNMVLRCLPTMQLPLSLPC